MKQEHSYGAVLYFYHNDMRYFILIGAIRKTGDVEYGFPKWHPEPSDTCILDNVTREIREETGISKDQLLIDTFDEKKIAFELSYLIHKNDEVKRKTSTYYAIEMKTRDPLTVLKVPREFIHEIADIRIVTAKDVAKLLTHDDEKRLFTRWLGNN
jgi:8-oxo-dGTP pyrophosphatase MutT (NUDIX family)